MQAIVETVFDAVYLVSVITIGILMIRGCKGSHQFKLFGLMAVVLGAGDSLPGQGQQWPDCRRLRSGCRAYYPVHDAAEPVAERRIPAVLGHLP